VPVRVGDVASVHRSVMPVYTLVTANGKPAVLLNIFRQPDSNTVAVADDLGREMEQIRHTLPQGVKLQSFYDQSVLVRDSIASVRDAILVGLILARSFSYSSSAMGQLAGRGLVIPATMRSR